MRTISAFLRAHALSSPHRVSAPRAGCAPVPARSVLAEAAAGELDSRPGLRPRHRPQRPHLDRAPAAHPARRREGRDGEPAGHQVLQGGAGGDEVRRRRQSAALLGRAGQGYDWPKNEHGIFVETTGNVWLAGNDKEDHQILKFTPDGKFLLQIGKPGTQRRLELADPARPARAHGDRRDRRASSTSPTAISTAAIIVFDAKTGAYKRHWGAYGTKTRSTTSCRPTIPKAPLSQSFGNPVHCVRLSNDGLVYVCDRVNDRIQVFRKDGSFVKEFRVEPQTLRERLGLGPGAVERPAAEIHLHGRRRQRPDHRAGARGRQGAVAMGPPRPPARPVQVGAQHRRSIRRATSTPPRSASAAACRNSGRRRAVR